ncbi:hypothetical protein [Streptomyces sp. MBT49]|uniref:hypothetical protein n=1 Tax=Streptomyces sp. MBT49 TaxID=1488380 RepID=UPI0035AB95B7
MREAAVTGEPDADLGERIVAWIVPVDPASPPRAPPDAPGARSRSHRPRSCSRRS